MALLYAPERKEHMAELAEDGVSHITPPDRQLYKHSVARVLRSMLPAVRVDKYYASKYN